MSSESTSEQAARVRVVGLEDGKRTDIPGGHWVCELVSGPMNDAAATMLGYSTWAPGADTKQLVHETDELAYITEGQGKLTIGTSRVPFRAGQALLIPAGVPHGIINDSDADMAMVYVFSHPEYPPTREATAEELAGEDVAASP